MEIVEESVEKTALWWLEQSGVLNDISSRMIKRSYMQDPSSVLSISVPVDCTEIRHYNRK